MKIKGFTKTKALVTFLTTLGISILFSTEALIATSKDNVKVKTKVGTGALIKRKLVKQKLDKKITKKVKTKTSTGKLVKSSSGSLNKSGALIGTGKFLEKLNFDSWQFSSTGLVNKYQKSYSGIKIETKEKQKNYDTKTKAS